MSLLCEDMKEYIGSATMGVKVSAWLCRGKDARGRGLLVLELEPNPNPFLLLLRSRGNESLHHCQKTSTSTCLKRDCKLISLKSRRELFTHQLIDSFVCIPVTKKLCTHLC